VTIEHVALWTEDLERLKAFYVRYFGVTAGEKYDPDDRPFESYFLSFSDGARLELMRRPDIVDPKLGAGVQTMGWTHIAISVGSPERVDSLTAELDEAGYIIASPARTTGDGYYESVVLDPDGNRVEITI
jgi:lactoylglutathione lyase